MRQRRCRRNELNIQKVRERANTKNQACSSTIIDQKKGLFHRRKPTRNPNRENKSLYTITTERFIGSNNMVRCHHQAHFRYASHSINYKGNWGWRLFVLTSWLILHIGDPGFWRSADHIAQESSNHRYQIALFARCLLAPLAEEMALSRADKNDMFDVHRLYHKRLSALKLHQPTIRSFSGCLSKGNVIYTAPSFCIHWRRH